MTKPKKRRICIVGYASTNREWANEQPKDVEIWGQNECHLFLKRWHRWFQIHPTNWNEAKREQMNLEMLNNALHSADIQGNLRQFAENLVVLPEHYGRLKLHIDWLAQCEVPVYTQEVDPRIPTSVKYPLKKVFKTFRRYLTSSCAYMVALALLEHKEGIETSEIRLAGVEMAYGTEWAHQRHCLEYWLGLAEGMGIKVQLPANPYGCSLLAAPVYSVDSLGPMPELLVPIHAKVATSAPLAAVSEAEVERNKQHTS